MFDLLKKTKQTWKFGRNFQTDMTIYVPKVYKDHSRK